MNHYALLHETDIVGISQSHEPIVADNAIEIPVETYQAMMTVGMDEFYYKNGEIHSRDPRPANYYIWDVTSEKWIEDVERAKEDISVEINLERAKRLKAGVSFNGRVFDSDVASMANITETLTMINAGVVLPEGFVWRTKDNENVPFDTVSFVEFATKVINYKNDCYIHSFNLKAQLMTLTNVEQVEAFVIDAGWPTNG